MTSPARNQAREADTIVHHNITTRTATTRTTGPHRRTHTIRRWLICAATILAGSTATLQSPTAYATNGDVFATGRTYCIDTYSGHPNWFGTSPAKWVLDINFPGDAGAPLYAPSAGNVTQVTTPPSGWGYSIVWTSSDGTEKLHLAHLNSVTATGTVNTGQQIGVLGNTGNSTGAHLHLSRSLNGTPAPVVLSGRTLDNPPIDRPNTTYGTCNTTNTYTSNGPLTNAEGSWVRATDTGEVFVIAGGAALYVGNPAMLPGRSLSPISRAQLNVLPRVPRDGTWVAGYPRGEVYVFAGGAPLYVGNPAMLPGRSVIEVDIAALDNAGVAGTPWSALRARPVNGTWVAGYPRGEVYVYAGGAALYVGNPAMLPGRQITEIDIAAIDNAGAAGSRWARLTSSPDDGTWVAGYPRGEVYVYAGGAALYVGNPAMLPGRQITEIDIAAIDNAGATGSRWERLRVVPRDGVLVSGFPRGEVYVYAGGAPLYVANGAFIGGRPVHEVDISAIDAAGRAGTTWARLRYRPLDGTILQSWPTGEFYTVTNGAPAPRASGPGVLVDGAAIANAGGTDRWSHLASVPSVPGVPVAVAGDAAASVSWSAPVSGGGSPVTGFEVEGAPGGSCSTAGGLSCTITGLTNGTAYRFRVRALNAVGPSAWSDYSTPVTPTTPGPTCKGFTVTVDLAKGQKPTAGDDVILGTAKADKIVALAGNDTICSLGGVDSIDPGAGDDWIDSGLGIDKIVYTAAPNPVTINLETGTATGWGTDTLTGIENATGSRHPDTMTGSTGPNVLLGGAGNDTLNAGPGNDTLNGGTGNDTCDGGPDTDTATTCETKLNIP